MTHPRTHTDPHTHRTIRQTSNGPRPMHSGAQGKCCVYMELTGRVTYDVWLGHEEYLRWKLDFFICLFLSVSCSLSLSLSLCVLLSFSISLHLSFSLSISLLLSFSPSLLLSFCLSHCVSSSLSLVLCYSLAFLLSHYVISVITYQSFVVTYHNSSDLIVTSPKNKEHN